MKLIFDIETVPDLDRLEQFGLDPLPELPPTMPSDDCQGINWLAGTIDDFKRRLAELHPDEGFARTIADVEAKAEKPRKGILGAIDDYLEGRRKIACSGDERIKLMSLVPEYCKIVAIGFAHPGSEPSEFVLPDAIGDEQEKELLGYFWERAADAQQLVGYNCLGFDLPVIFVRSILLGVQPTREISLSPYGNQVVDLYSRRFPRGNGRGPGSLKDIARLLGIPNDLPDMDGGCVYAAFTAGEWDRIREYVRSDVKITSELFCLYQGLFC